MKPIRATQPHFRKNTELPQTQAVFVLTRGGIGDFINYTPAIQWAIRSNPQLLGYILTPGYFRDLADLWFKQFEPRFFVETCDMYLNHPTMFDGEFEKYVPSMQESMGPIGYHLMDLGWAYYCHHPAPSPELNVLPHVDKIFPNMERYLSWNLPGKYAVVTTGAMAPTKMLPPKTYNEISKHLVSKGITPVFLGKKELRSDVKNIANPGIDYSLGCDLRENTSLVEAAVIMANASLVVGLDNGLLHLACCSDVPVVFGYSFVSPEQMPPRRKPGVVTKIVEPPEWVTCRGCQYKMRFLKGLDFKNCYYKDFLCCESLTSDLFITKIDEILEGKC